MKVAIIGAGNMGGAIARGLAQGTIIPASDVTVADPFSGSLETLQADYPEINVTTENPKAIKDADIVILAVKPWLIDQVLSVVHLTPRQVLVSIAGGVTFEQLVKSVGPEQTIFRLIPNTAISQLESMTLISSRNASKEQEQLMLDIFNELGLAMLIPESQMAATTALTSCGIAYVLKYIQAAMQAAARPSPISAAGAMRRSPAPSSIPSPTWAVSSATAPRRPARPRSPPAWTPPSWP